MASRRFVAAAATVATAASLLLAVPRLAGAAPTPPPNPSDGQISAAQSQKDALASRVGFLGGQIAQARIELARLAARRELAEQKYTYALSKLQDAQTAAQRARALEVKAQKSVDAAHQKFVTYVQATYMGGEIDGTTGSLLTATDPTSLLDEAALAQYQAAHKVDFIGQLQTAKVAKSNADAAARLAVQNAARATAAAKTAKQAATAAFAAEQAQQITLQNTLASSQRELDAAQSELATLNNQRAQYLAYKVEQARLARIRAEKARQARLRAEQAARDRARARARHRQHSGNGGGVPISDPGPSAPGGGGWTAAKGRQAANRALTWLGEPYIWSGGNAYGPTNGGCTDPVAPCGTVGFDCSGLVLYAWGRNNWAHFAASQYFVGSYHPSAGNFQKGDLLFWTGGESQISHVAIYVGGGNVVQAPQSGDIVKVTPWDQVESGYAGATRPLT